jgi:outer membrane protein assembly factor BamB
VAFADPPDKEIPLHQFVQLDATTGTRKWSTSWSLLPPPEVRDESMYLPRPGGDAGGETVRFDPTTKTTTYELPWSKPTDYDDRAVYYGGVEFDDRTGFQGSYGTLKAFDLESGSVHWETDIDGYFRTQPARTRDLIWAVPRVLEDAKQRLLALDPETGDRVRTFEMERPTKWVVGLQNTLIVGYDTGIVSYRVMGR